MRVIPSSIAKRALFDFKYRKSFVQLRVRRSDLMPIFEYVCQDCEHGFEALVYGSEKAECPKCHSKKLASQLSTFAVASKGAAKASPSSGPCGSCGDPAGPGACSMRDFD
jgi:putative FmdB family regulatory protein